MKTAVVFENFDSGFATVAIMKGDFSNLHNKFINLNADDAECDEIDSLIRKACLQGGVEEYYTSELPIFPSKEFYEAVKEGCVVIVTGFAP